MDAPDDLGLDLDLVLGLDLGLGLLLLPAAPPCAQSGSVLARHSVEIGWEIFFLAYLRSCASQQPPDGQIGTPHSGESLASCVAARHASAFDLESRSSLHAFHTSRPCVTWVSNPLVLTRTSPTVVDLDARAVGNLAPLNMASPTGFRVPLVPLQLWKAVQADMSVALTACWFIYKYFAASSRSTMVMWSSLLQSTTDLHVVHGHLEGTASVSPQPGGSGQPFPSVVHSRAAVAVGHIGDVELVGRHGWLGIATPSPGSGGRALP
jgi:hypothetical protein